MVAAAGTCSYLGKLEIKEIRIVGTQLSLSLFLFIQSKISDHGTVLLTCKLSFLSHLNLSEIALTDILKVVSPKRFYIGVSWQ